MQQEGGCVGGGVVGGGGGDETLVTGYCWSVRGSALVAVVPKLTAASSSVVRGPPIEVILEC